MGFNTKFLLSCLFMLSVSLTVNAAVVFGPGGTLVFDVGDDYGWSPKSHFNYTWWMPRPRYLIGDSLRFIYDPSITNVLEVTSPDYQSCNPTSPLATYNSGNDTILLTEIGYKYFISGNPVDCNNDMRFEIDVGNSSYVRKVRQCPNCNNNEVKRPKCHCDKDTFWGGREELPSTAPTPTISPGSTSAAPTMSPGSSSARGLEGSTPTMSPNSTSGGAMPPSPTTSAASKKIGNHLFVIVAAGLQFLAMLFFISI